MGDQSSVLLVVAIAIGLALVVLGWRRRRPSDPEAVIQAAVMEAERDRQKTEALEAVETSRHQWPPGGSG